MATISPPPYTCRRRPLPLRSRWSSRSTGEEDIIPAAPLPSQVTAFQAVTSNPEFGNFKDLREKSREDGALLVSNRKVRLPESPSGSLYALCRSWVWNGLSQELQPNFGDGIRLLPRPLPLKVTEPEHDDPEKEEAAMQKFTKKIVDMRSPKNCSSGKVAPSSLHRMAAYWCGHLGLRETVFTQLLPLMVIKLLLFH